jgi:hypothetical protein
MTEFCISRNLEVEKQKHFPIITLAYLLIATLNKRTSVEYER